MTAPDLTFSLAPPDRWDAQYLASGHLVWFDGGDGLWAAPFDPLEMTLLGEALPVLSGVSGFMAQTQEKITETAEQASSTIQEVASETESSETDEETQ